MLRAGKGFLSSELMARFAPPTARSLLVTVERCSTRSAVVTSWQNVEGFQHLPLGAGPTAG